MSTPPATTAILQHKHIRLVTLNSWKGEGQYTQRVELMALGLQHCQPDIVCLQEALQTEDGTMDTAGSLGRELGLEVTFGPGRFKTRSVEGSRLPCYSGLAILSKIKPFAFHLSPLPCCDDDPDRTVLTALIDWNGLPLTITTVHLTHIPGKDRLRERQLTSALHRSRLLTAQWGMPSRTLSLCCGDMNQELDSTVLAGLQANTALSVHDCYLEGGGRLPGCTFGTEEKPPCRIDYILHLQGEGNAAVRCSNGRVVLNQRNREGLMPSDHRAVMVDILVPQESAGAPPFPPSSL